MKKEGLDEIFKINTSKIRPYLNMVLRHLYFGPGPCNFRRILISHFLESVFEGKRTFRVGFGHHFHGWPKPHLFALKYSP